MDQVRIGAFLKKLRKEKNLTQEQFAEHLGVSNRTVSRWETGSNMPDISLLVEIADFYEVSIPELINGERKSENMNNEVKEVANTMADYATAEKEDILKRVRNNSLVGVAALAVMMLMDLVIPEARSEIAEKVYMYCQTLVYVIVFMTCMLSTGLVHKLHRNRKEVNLPKPVFLVLSAVVAFVLAALLKYLLTNLFGIL